MYDGLIRFPLVEYRHANRTRWGTDIFPDGMKQVAVVRALPWVMALLGPRLVVAAARRDWRTARGPFVLLAAGGAAAASIAYLPDVIHIAFIAGVFAIGLADCFERGLRVAVRRWLLLRWSGPCSARSSGVERPRAGAHRGLDTDSATVRIEWPRHRRGASVHMHALAYPLVQAWSS